MKKAMMFFCVVAGLGIMAQSVGAKPSGKGQRRGMQPETVVIADPYKEAVDGILNAIAEKQEALASIDAAIEQEQAAAQALISMKKAKGFDDLKPRDILKSAANISQSAVRQRKIKRDLVKSIKDLEKSLDLLGWEGPMLTEPVAHCGFIVSFKSIEPFEPRTPKELLNSFTERHWQGARTHHFRTHIQGGKLTGHICVDNDADKNSLAEALERSDKLTLVKIRAVTQKEFEEHCRLGQPSLPPPPNSIGMECISGDVTIRRQKPRYYVMQKVVDNDTALISGLIAYWKFDEGEGNTAYDSTGDHDGVVHGAQWTMGRIGGALSFDGVDNYVSCGSDASLDLTEFTWALWVKRTETNYSDERVLISANSLGESTTGTYSLQIDARGSRQNKVQFVKHAQSQMISQTPIADTNWHHVAVTRNGGGDVVIYIDGVADVSDNIGKRDAFDGILIGAGVKYYSNFKGFIDDVRIYNRALTVPEIKQLYGNLKIPNAAKGPVVYVDRLAVDGIVVRQSHCTAQFVESMLGKPRKKDGSMLRYTDSGIDFCFPRNGSLSEIHLNRGFKGKLDTGISLTSTKQDVFRAYAEPVEIICTDNLHQAKGERVLRQNGNVSRMYYGNEGLIFWFRDDSVIQIVVFKGRMKRSDSNPILPDSLVGHWKFDGDANDSVGKNHGKIHGAKWVKGNFGGALRFDSIDDSVEITGYKGILGSNPRTCTAWIRAMNTEDTYYSIMSWGNDNTGSCWYIALNGRGDRGNMGALRLMVVGGNICGTTDLRDGRWHHVAVVLPDDGAADVCEALLYIDGLPEEIIYSRACEINTGDTTEDVSRNDVLIGKFYRTGTDEEYNFDGLIDDVRIYDRALDSDEVASLAVGDPSLVAHWKFDGDANDSVGINHGVVHGAQSTDGVLGGALVFDGQDDYVSLPHVAVTTTEFTITAWANALGSGGGKHHSNPVFTQRYQGSGALLYDVPTVILYTHVADTTQAGADIRSSDGDIQNIYAASPDLGQWHHYALTVSANTITFYIDGVESASADNLQSGNYNTNIDFVAIGMHRYHKPYNGIINSGFFNGMIDDVRIYDRALDSDEVATLADVDPSLVAHWTFDDTLNDSALDNDAIGHQMGAGVTYVEGIFGEACDFNGVGSWHGVEPSSFIEIDGSGTYNEYSISVWFKTGNDNYRPFFSDAHGAGAHTHGRPEMGTYGGKVYVVGSDTGLPGPELRLFSRSGYGDDQWHHAVGIGDSISNVVELYVDGNYVGLNGLADVYPLILDNGGTPDTRCEIGARSRKKKYYVGQVDDMRIYSGKISASKVRQLYAAGSR